MFQCTITCNEPFIHIYLSQDTTVLSSDNEWCVSEIELLYLENILHLLHYKPHQLQSQFLGDSPYLNYHKKMKTMDKSKCAYIKTT